MIAIPVYNERGKSTDSLQLETTDVVRKEVSPKTFACAIRMLCQNWRQGTVGCKTRGELAFSNKKPWRQKGTGRARVSSIRSPIWRKGGVIFGPQPRTRELGMNKQQSSLVLNNLLFDRVDTQTIHSFDFDLKGQLPSSKAAAGVLQGMGLEHKKVVLFLTHDDELSFASFRNLPNVSIVLFDQPNAYHLSNAACWIFLKKDFDSFKNMVVQWN